MVIINRLLPALCVCLLCASAAAAQDMRISMGAKVGLYVSNAKPFVGAIADIPLGGELHLEPGLELVGGVRGAMRLVPDLNARLFFGPAGTGTGFFILGGFGLRVDVPDEVGSTEAGFRINLGLGAVLNTRSFLRPWAGAKIYMLDQTGSDVGLQAGVMARF